MRWAITSAIPTTGLPAHDSLVAVVNTISGASYTFRMAPDYHVNNCLHIGHNNSSWTPIMGPATFTLTTPAPYTTLSVLASSGNGPCTIQYTVHYANGTSESSSISITDWWSANADSYRHHQDF